MFNAFNTGFKYETELKSVHLGCSCCIRSSWQAFGNGQGKSHLESAQSWGYNISLMLFSHFFELKNNPQETALTKVYLKFLFLMNINQELWHGAIFSCKSGIFEESNGNKSFDCVPNSVQMHEFY
jgi:hypothetical protein